MALPQMYEEKEFYTEDEYFAFERKTFGRWEYVRGRIRAMAGGSDDHNTITANIGATLRAALLPRGCRVYVADMKVHTGDDANTFPDVTVVCGPRAYYRGRTEIITNPILVVEVLSESTEGYDRSEKFDHYRTIPTLTDYLLVDQDQARVLLCTRDGDHWTLREFTGPDSSVPLSSVGVTLALSDVYALIDFDGAGMPSQ